MTRRCPGHSHRCAGFDDKYGPTLWHRWPWDPCGCCCVGKTSFPQSSPWVCRRCGSILDHRDLFLSDHVHLFRYRYLFRVFSASWLLQISFFLLSSLYCASNAQDNILFMLNDTAYTAVSLDNQKGTRHSPMVGSTRFKLFSL